MRAFRRGHLGELREALPMGAEVRSLSTAALKSALTKCRPGHQPGDGRDVRCGVLPGGGSMHERVAIPIHNKGENWWRMPAGCLRRAHGRCPARRTGAAVAEHLNSITISQCRPGSRCREAGRCSGGFSESAARASRSTRARRSSRWAMCSGRTLMATVWSSRVSRAL
jgi:hypothetical protein